MRGFVEFDLNVLGGPLVPRAHICALPTVWKGLLYDADALDGTLSLLSGVTTEALDVGQLDVARRGLRADMGGHKVLDLARELVKLADGGLARIHEEGFSDGDERGFLDPLHEQIEKGKSPGEEVAERWKDEWNGDRQKLIEATRY